MTAISAIWRAGDRLVARVEDVAAANLEARQGYFVIDPTGKIVERYLPDRVGLGGMVTWTEYAVRGDELVRTTIVGTFSGTDEDDEIVLTNLQLDDNPDARDFVKTVLDDDIVAAEERRLREN